MANQIEALIVIIGNVLTLLIIADALLSFFLSPYHPVREAFGRILQPLYAPLRRVIPPMGMFDFTPIILILLIRVVVSILTSIL